MAIKKLAAKYPGSCGSCGRAVPVGAEISYNTDTRRIDACAGCLAEKEAAAAGAPSETRLKLDGRGSKGQIVRNPIFGKEPKKFAGDQAKKDYALFSSVAWLYVLEERSFRYFDDDSEKWKTDYQIVCRAATEQESAADAAVWERKERQARCRGLVLDLVRWISVNGTHPEMLLQLPSGLRLDARQDGSPNQDFLVRSGNVLWGMVYNGRDGDDWRPNNYGGYICSWVEVELETEAWLAMIEAEIGGVA